MCTKAIRRLGAVVCLLGVVLWMTAAVMLHTMAADVKGSLTILSKTEEDVMLVGMQWDIFKVGERNDKGEYELQGDFAQFPVSLKDTSTSALAFAAETLDAFATVHKLKPLDSKKADANGALKFDDLGVGLYLVAGDYVQIGETYYFPAPFFMEITEFGGENQVYDMTAYPKYIYMNASDKAEYTVRKIWENDENHTFTRSSYVTVQIYCDDELYETVRLDESNNWEYSWKADKPYDWKVIEIDIPKDYFVVFRNEEKKYAVVNSFNTDSSIEDSTDWTDSEETDIPPSTEGETEDTTADTQLGTEVTTTTTSTTSVTTTTAVSTTIITTTTTPEKLPQTGQLWWPVPVLALSGLILMGIGFKMRTKE